MVPNVTIGVKKLDELAELPTYSDDEVAGADVRSMIEYTLKPGERFLFPTGLAMEIPMGWEIQVRPRSGLAFKHGITVLNTPGTIDSSYLGHIGVVLINHGDKEIHISRGDRIAQLVISKCYRARFKEVEIFEKETVRGEGGFGSTGGVKSEQ